MWIGRQFVPAASAPCGGVALAIVALLLGGCYAPMRSPGIPAQQLPDSYRLPLRTAGLPLNYSSLVAPPPTEYLLGPGDLLEITVPDLIERGDAQPFQAQILGSGAVHVPRVGPVHVEGLSLAEAQRRINEAVAAGFLQNPHTTVTLLEKASVSVVVLGAVQHPGVHALPRYEHDVAHALAAAGGFTEEAAEVIEVHRSDPSSASAPGPPGDQPRWPTPVQPPPGFQQAPPAQTPAPSPAAPDLPFPTSSGGPYQSYRVDGPVLPAGHSPQGRGFAQPAGFREAVAAAPAISQQMPPRRPPHTPYIADPVYAQGHSDQITRIPLRGDGGRFLTPAEVLLSPGDVVVVPEKRDEVFFVVGPISQNNRVRFSVGDQDREIGNGFLLPRDREIDVVTAVAMAGYIDPIDSPTTVTVHRTGPDGMPLLIHVDLIRARSDPRETVLVQSGDIIYLNPDHWWYSRRLFDRIIGGALSSATGRWLAP